MSSARIFEHNGFAGRNVLVNNPGHARYVLAAFDFLNSLGFNDIASSLQLRSSTPQFPSTCLLFENSRFDGRFKAFAYNGDRDIAALPDFNDMTSSAILMDHNPTPTRTVLRLRQIAGASIDAAIDVQLQTARSVSRSGPVRLRFTIDLFEASLFGVDLVLIEVPVTVHTPWPFPDYNANIRYWVKLFIDSTHRLRGFVAAWGYWIEGGLLTGTIESRLRPQVEANIGALETQLNAMLVELDFHTWTDVYLMPGSAQVDGDYDGDINDDCTVVLPFQDSR
jgi:hypothetical protein